MNKGKPESGYRTTILTLAAIAAIFALGSETFVAAVSLTASVLFQAVTDFDNVAEDIYWRLAWTWSSEERYGTVCYFGLLEGTPVPPFSLDPGQSVRPTVTVENAIRDELPYEGWGYGTPGLPAPLDWSVDPAGVVDLDPDEVAVGLACEVTAVDEPEAEEAKVTVTLEAQPARRDFDVAMTVRTCTLADAIVEVGQTRVVGLEVDPAVPAEGITEYEWQASGAAGELVSADDGSHAPFTSNYPFAAYHAGSQAGSDTVEAKVAHRWTSGRRTTLCEASGRIDVVPDLRLQPALAEVAPGAAVTFTCQGCGDLEGPVVFAWQTGGWQGKLLDDQGHAVEAFESATATSVTYQARADASGGNTDGIELTAWRLQDNPARVGAGHGTAQIRIQREEVPPCEVHITVYEASADWKWGDPNPNDVECELAEGTWVIDPDSLKGCMTAAPCVAQCLGYGDPVSVGAPIQWTTYDLEGNNTGGNHCGAPGQGSCEADVAWTRRACAENFCEHAGMEGGGFKCAACNCACGGGNCYPWKGPAKIVFDAWVNVPCTDTYNCYYYHTPQQIRGDWWFTLVHCPSVDNALPNCPGNVP